MNMIDLMLISICLFSSTLASYYDLKTTEVPDKIFYLTIFLSLPFLLFKIFALHEFSFLFYGILFSFFGFLLYKVGQWGGADATLFGIFGFLLPEKMFGFQIFPTQINFIINFFFVGSLYLIIYSFILLYKSGNFSRSLKEVKKVRKLIFGFSLLTFIPSFLLSFFLLKDLIFSFFSALTISAFYIILFSLYKILRFIEKKIFIRKIPVSKLKVGDMLLKRRELVGITKDEIKKIKKSGKKFVWIKEGVRFVPVFPISLLLTLFFNNLILILLIPELFFLQFSKPAILP